MSAVKKRAGGSRGPCLPAVEASDVDEMLRAAEDELLMDLHVGSHNISSSLDLNLARRFEALKTPRLRPPPNATQPIPPPQHSASQSKILETKDQILGDANIMARFSALKGSTSKPQPTADPVSDCEDSTDDELSEDGDDGNKFSKKEVEKVILWAMDAARLDPSARNDEEDDVEKACDEVDDDAKESESELEEKKKRAKGKGMHEIMVNPINAYIDLTPGEDMDLEK